MKQYRYELWCKGEILGQVQNTNLYDAWSHIHRMALSSNKDHCEIRVVERTPIDPFENIVMTDNRGNTYTNLENGVFQTILENGAVLTIGPEDYFKNTHSQPQEPTHHG